MPSKLSREEFVERSKHIHNGKYDYSLVEYINTTTPVKIICSVHGVFEQTPKNHLKGWGCKRCGSIAGAHKLTTNDFIKKASEIHNNKYDYSLVEYKRSDIPVKIICPIHGVFEQTPIKHCNTLGCAKCYKEMLGENRRLTRENFIEKAKERHGDKFDYSKVVYINSRTPIKIICPIHGEYEMIAGHHLHGAGCLKCSEESRLKGVENTKLKYQKETKERKIKREEDRIKRLDTFIERAKKIHDNKYDYSLVNYVNSTTRILIICPVHGVFEQLPTNHLKGCGCPKCGIERLSGLFRDNKECFIEKAKKAHGDRYDYSLVEYVNSITPVKIICPIHGEFSQTPGMHNSGQGCPICGTLSSKDELEICEFIKTLTNDEVLIRDHSTIKPKELDIYIPSKKVAFEFNGLRWHCDLFIPNNQHLNKTNICEENGIELCQIFENEWVHNKKLAKNRIKNILHYTNNDIEYSIIEISNDCCNFQCGELNGFILFNIENDKLVVNDFSTPNVKVLKNICLKISEKNNIKNIEIHLDRRWISKKMLNKFIVNGFIYTKTIEPSYVFVCSKNSYRTVYSIEDVKKNNT